MFSDLISLFSGWYSDYVESIRDLLQTSETVYYNIALDDGAGGYISDIATNTINPSIWSAYVPWEQIIAAVVLVTFTVCIFKFMRSVLCRIL